MKTTLGRLQLLVIAALVVLPVPASAYPGENQVVKGRYYESRGDLATAEAIYADIIARKISPRAVRSAVRRLTLIAQARNDTAAEMQWLEAAVQAGETSRLANLARLSTDTGRLPPSFRAMAGAYETAAETTPSTSLAIFMAERAEAGDLGGTGVRNTDPMYWYRLAIARGSQGAAATAVERLLAAGRVDEALTLLAAMGPDRAAGKIVSIAKDIARGTGGARGDPKRAAKLLARAPAKEADSAAVSLMREAATAGDVPGALFWLARAGSARDGIASGIARIYEKTDDPAVRKRLVAELEARGAAGNAEATAQAARILIGEGGMPTPDMVRVMLASETTAVPESVDRIARLIGRMPASDPATAGLVAALTTAADGGNAVAMTVLARFYATGGPVVVDAAASRIWTERAAEAGSAEAEYRLGLALAMGEAADSQRSHALLARAAERGYAPARAALAALVTTTGATP